MKQTVEEAANEYRRENVPSIDKFPKAIKKAFVAGVEWQSNQSPWISVEERLPEDYELKFILLKDGQVRSALLDSTDKNDFNVEYYWYDRDNDMTFDFENVVAWMPIPSFDQILKANKDVLQRLKEKGD